MYVLRLGQDIIKSLYIFEVTRYAMYGLSSPGQAKTSLHRKRVQVDCPSETACLTTAHLVLTFCGHKGSRHMTLTCHLWQLTDRKVLVCKQQGTFPYRKGSSHQHCNTKVNCWCYLSLTTPGLKDYVRLKWRGIGSVGKVWKAEVLSCVSKG